MNDRCDPQFDKKAVARAFDRAAPGYCRHAALQDLIAARLDERLQYFRMAPRWVLDLGSGCGNGTRLLTRRYRTARVIACDLAAGMLKVARDGGRRWFTRERYLCADAERLPLGPGSVDLIFSSLSLQWCNDLDAVFAECRRVLTVDGLLIFATLGPDTLGELRASWGRVDAGTHVSAFPDMHDVGDALIRAGLSAPVLDVERVTTTYADVPALMRELKGLGAHNATVGRQRTLTGRRAMRAMIEAYETYRIDGRIPATHEIVYGHAWRPAPTARRQDGSTVATFPLHKLRRPGP
jgi:malonyl-CoA O-methyltransferase